MKLWCFGDSNTYGYDPCGFFGGRYAAPWPELLAGKTGFQVINDGKNGRMIPERDYDSSGSAGTRSGTARTRSS